MRVRFFRRAAPHKRRFLSSRMRQLGGHWKRVTSSMLTYPSPVSRTPEPRERDCSEKQRFLDQLSVISNELAILDAEDLQSALAGEFRQDARRMNRARELKLLLLERLRNHVIQHGCGQNPLGLSISQRSTVLG
jgi:hypothetical protein